MAALICMEVHLVAAAARRATGLERMVRARWRPFAARLFEFRPAPHVVPRGVAHITARRKRFIRALSCRRFSPPWSAPRNKLIGDVPFHLCL